MITEPHGPLSEEPGTVTHQLAPQLRQCAVRVEDVVNELRDQARGYALASELAEIARTLRALSEATLSRHRGRSATRSS
jgi:hypothetical protein